MRSARLESVVTEQNIDGARDLVDLDSGINQEGQVGNANANDLNGVFHAQSIPNNNQFVKEAKNEESQKSWYCLVLRLHIGTVNVGSEAGLESGENVGFKGQADDGLKCSDGHEGRGPFALDEAPGVMAYTHGRRRRRYPLPSCIALVQVAQACIVGIRRLGVSRLRVFRRGISGLRICLAIVAAWTV